MVPKLLLWLQQVALNQMIIVEMLPKVTMKNTSLVIPGNCNVCFCLFDLGFGLFFALPKGAFTNYVCIFWPRTYPPLFALFMYCKNYMFLTTYTPLNANVICESSLRRKYLKASTRISINHKPSNYSRYVITSGAPDHPAEYDEPNGGTPNERCKHNTKHFVWKYHRCF